MYTTNAFYGNAIVLAAYAGIPDALFPRTIPGYVQPWIGQETPDAGARSGVPAFVWGPAARIRRHRAGLRNHTVIGAPWMYLLALESVKRIPVPPVPRHRLPEPPEPSRLLYFPHHGLAGDLAAQQRAAALRGQKHVTVALTHQQAASANTVQAYEEVGATVVDLGQAVAPVGSIDPFFLQRVLTLMRAHQSVRTDGAGVFSYFAHAAGLPVDAGVRAPELARRTRDELGTDSVLPPQELRALFDWSTHV